MLIFSFVELYVTILVLVCLSNFISFRSSTLDTVIKGQRNIMQTGSGPSLLVPPGVAVPVYTEKSIDCFEPSTPGYLLPSSHCRKVYWCLTVWKKTPLFNMQIFLGFQ